MKYIERIPSEELQLRFVRGSGPGGQNVNKVATAVQLRFDVAATRALPARVKARLRALAGNRLTNEGALLILARNHRTQEANRREALARLDALIGEAMVEPTPRVATKPTRGARERRLDSKRRRRQVKQLRSPVGEL
jgi:ribosome-associated protein